MDAQAAKARLAEQIFKDLRRRIIRGEISPDERLPAERQLAEAYGATRNTVREAIRKLEQGRLVSVRHGQGVTVADFRRCATLEILEPFLESCPDPVERGVVLRELLDARAEVLSWAVDLAVQRATPADRDRIASSGAAMIVAARGGDAIGLARETQHWIDALVDSAHALPVRWLANAFLDLHEALITRFPALCVIDPGVEHYIAGFLHALDSGDARGAREMTRAYFQRVDRLLLQRAVLLGPSPPPGTPSAARPRE